MDKPITPKEFAERMKALKESADDWPDKEDSVCPEATHEDAEGIMCDLLKALGYGEGVGYFEQMTKWYG